MTPCSKPLLESSKAGSALSRGDKTIFSEKQGNQTQNPGQWMPRMGGWEAVSYSLIYFIGKFSHLLRISVL